MCGIVAVISKSKAGLYQKEVTIFREMLIVDQLRGMDGTGIFYNKGKWTSKVIKTALPSTWFVNSKEYENVESYLVRESQFVVGHNRAATKGKVDNISSHPFREQHITLVHNGTISNQKEFHPTIEVDSNAICYGMATLGEREAIEKIDGAFALVWLNAKEGKLKFCRNFQRPLNIIETKDFWVLASEAKMAEWILSRNTTTVLNIKEVEPKKLYEFDLEDTTVYDVSDIKYKEWVTSTNKQFHGNMWPHAVQGSVHHDNGIDDLTGYGGSWNETPPANTSSPTVSQVPAVQKVHGGRRKTFSFGQDIRFKAGMIRKTPSGTTYLDGDILIPQGITDPKYIYPRDYEDEWRIRVFGSPEILAMYIGQDYLIGKVNTSLIWDGRTSYNVSGVRIEHNMPDKVVENTHNVTEKYCDVCGAEGNNFVVVQDIRMCPSCEGHLAHNAAVN